MISGAFCCARMVTEPSGRVFATLFENEGARVAREGTLSNHDPHTRAVGAIAVIVAHIPVIIDSGGCRTRCPVSAAIPNPGAAGANGDAFIPPAFAPISAIFGAVDGTAIIAFIATAFPPVSAILDKIRTPRRIKPPLTGISRLTGADASRPENSDTRYK